MFAGHVFAIFHARTSRCARRSWEEARGRGWGRARQKKENVGVGIDHSDTVDFIRSNNHTIAQAHDISCVCMHPLCIGFRFCAYLVILQSFSFHFSIIVLIESASATEELRFGFWKPIVVRFILKHFHSADQVSHLEQLIIDRANPAHLDIRKERIENGG